MTDQAPATKETKPWWPKIAAATPPVLIFLGCCYLEGYWGSFNVRFLDYITFNEVIARSFLDVVPVGVLLIEIVVAMLFITRIKRAPGWLQRWADRQKAKPKNRAQQWVEANPVGFSLIINGVIFLYGFGAMIAAFVQELFFGGLLFGGGLCVAAAGGFILERLWPKVIPNSSGAPICMFICLTPFSVISAARHTQIITRKASSRARPGSSPSSSERLKFSSAWATTNTSGAWEGLFSSPRKNTSTRWRFPNGSLITSESVCRKRPTLPRPHLRTPRATSGFSCPRAVPTSGAHLSSSAAFHSPLFPSAS